MTQPLRIGVVCYPSVGGSGVVAAELARGLAHRGHRVHLIATALPARAVGDGTIHFHPVEVPAYPVLEHGPYESALAGRIIEVARHEGLDVLHAHYAVPHAVSALLARQVLGARAPKTVITLHGTDVTRLGPHPNLRALTAHALQAADGITAPSRFLRVQAAERLGVPEARVEVIANFVDVDRFAPPARRDPGRLHALFDELGDGPVLIHVSNFRLVKRPTDLIEVLVRLRDRVPARLVLVGDGPERAATIERARALGVDGAVRWLGQRAELVGLLGQADGFLMTSESESFGVAALEALAAGVPVFGYRVGGLPDLVTEEVGRLVPFADLDALAGAVVGVLADPARRQTMGQAARARAVAHFRDQPAIDHYERYFRRIVAGETPR